MLPDPDDFPSAILESFVRIGVPGSIRLDLFSPPSRIVLRGRSMFWAAVPETAVYEDRYAFFDEGDVDRSSCSGNGSVESIAESSRP